MDVTLENVDVIRERTGVTYQEAVDYLTAAQGDVVQALVLIERDEKARQKELRRIGGEVMSRLKDVVKKGNATKIKVEYDGKVVAEIPVTIGVVGAMLAPEIAALGAVVALATGCSLEVSKANGPIVQPIAQG